MNIQGAKLELVELILRIENVEFINSVTDFIQKKSVDFWDELSVEEQEDIKKGIEQLNDGKRMEFHEFMEENA